MKNQAKIVVEWRNGEWHAWVSDVPDFTRSAATPGDAMAALLSLFTEIQFAQREVTMLEGSSTPDHLEFLVPFHWLHSIPKASEN